MPGASLNGREPSSLKIPELKCWLQCRRAPTKGKKADLITRLAACSNTVETFAIIKVIIRRIHALLANGWADRVFDPDNSAHNAQSKTQQLITK